MRTFTIVLLALLLAPMGQVGAQNPCGACTPKDTTLAALNAFKAKVNGVDKSQDARIASLQASRSKMQRDIQALANKLVDLNSRSTTDVSVTNQLARQNAELARQKAELARVENKLFELNESVRIQLADARAKALEQANKDTRRKTSGLSTGDKWLIGSTVAVVTGGLVYLAIKKWGGSEIHTSSSSYSCAGSNCR